MSDFEKQYRGKHQKLSIIKSCIRIGTCIGALTTLYFGEYGLALGELAVGFLIAELLGIAEEMF